MDGTRLPGARKSPRELKPEYLALGLLDQAPAHGYELYKAFGRELAELWRISESQFYALLRRLEAQGLVTSAEAAGTRARRVLAPTRAGREAFEAWLAAPSPASPRLLHVEFLSRLAFARARSPALAARLAAEQRSLLAAELSRLKAAAPEGAEADTLGGLSREFRRRQLEAAQAWIAEGVERSLAKDPGRNRPS